MGSANQFLVKSSVPTTKPVYQITLLFMTSKRNELVIDF